MTKKAIIDEIKRTAQANSGVPLGSRKFATETGIRERDWKGEHWARWSEAVREAGFAPNSMTKAYTEAHLLEKYACLALEHGSLPTDDDIKLSITNGRDIPDTNTYLNKFRGKPKLVAKLREYCNTRPEFAAVVALCDDYVPPRAEESHQPRQDNARIGFVYLMKSANYYKIGKANATGRRHRQLAIQLPESLILVHEIKTDDPFGIEAY